MVLMSEKRRSKWKKTESTYAVRVIGRKCHSDGGKAGYFTCLACGEEQARAVKHCIVPMHKSNYVVVSDRNLLTGVNQKGGLVK
jgi:hypothetical protein